MRGLIRPLRGRVLRCMIGALALIALTLAATSGGQRYFYCRAMDRVMAPSACCATSHLAAPHSVSPLNDCFEVRFLDRLGAFTTALPTLIAPPALLAILPAPVPRPAPKLAALAPGNHPIRAGPFRVASASGVRAELMVFLI